MNDHSIYDEDAEQKEKDGLLKKCCRVNCIPKWKVKGKSTPTSYNTQKSVLGGL